MLRIIAGGHQLDYTLLKSANPEQPILVFLHEGLGCRQLWRAFPERVAEATGCGALVFSRWGYGRSESRPGPWPVSFMHDEALKALPDLLSQLGITRAVLYGHSDGGSIALIYAARHPGVVRGVITEAAHAFVEDITVASIVAARERFLRDDLRSRLRKHHGDNTDSLFRGWSDVWLSPAFRFWDIRPLLSDVRCPLLAIQGVDDEYGTPAQVETIASTVTGPCESWLLDACGHAPHREHPRAVFDRVTAFVRRCSGAHCVPTA